MPIAEKSNQHDHEWRAKTPTKEFPAASQPQQRPLQPEVEGGHAEVVAGGKVGQAVTTSKGDQDQRVLRQGENAKVRSHGSGNLRYVCCLSLHVHDYYPRILMRSK